MRHRVRTSGWYEGLLLLSLTADFLRIRWLQRQEVESLSWRKLSFFQLYIVTLKTVITPVSTWLDHTGPNNQDCRRRLSDVALPENITVVQFILWFGLSQVGTSWFWRSRLIPLLSLVGLRIKQDSFLQPRTNLTVHLPSTTVSVTESHRSRRSLIFVWNRLFWASTYPT